MATDRTTLAAVVPAVPRGQVLFMCAKDSDFLTKKYVPLPWTCPSRATASLAPEFPRLSRSDDVDLFCARMTPCRARPGREAEWQSIDCRRRLVRRRHQDEGHDLPSCRARLLRGDQGDLPRRDAPGPDRRSVRPGGRGRPDRAGGAPAPGVGKQEALGASHRGGGLDEADPRRIGQPDQQLSSSHHPLAGDIVWLPPVGGR